jgi:hypothetical protein
MAQPWFVQCAHGLPGAIFSSVENSQPSQQAVHVEHCLSVMFLLSAIVGVTTSGIPVIV